MLQYSLTNKQARQFLLLKHGLIGDHKFIGKEGIKQFVNQAGCIQFDPIDVCGKNAELVLQSRIKGFTKSMLYDLLYEERYLLDYYDKNLAIIKAKDWCYFERMREFYRNHSRSKELVNQVSEQIKDIIREKGPICSKDIDQGQKVDWYWSKSSLSRAALETMYFRGDLIIHHKKGTMKYYALAEDYIPKDILHREDPCKAYADYIRWNVFRRISSVGLLWNKPSDAWLCIMDMKAPDRKQAFEQLLKEDKLIEIIVEGIKDPLYCNQEDKGLLDFILTNPKLRLRTEFIAPLDNMMWDRKLIKALFGFDYKWEIYTPEAERKYGYYVLPILHNESFVGRIELVNNRKSDCLLVKNVWLEPGIKITKKLTESLEKAIKRFANFNSCRKIEYMNFIHN